MKLHRGISASFLLVALLSADGAASLEDQPAIGKNGGTLLVYEIDTDKRLPEGYKPEAMVEAIKRRLDPAGSFGMQVKAAKDNRFEIGIPRRRDHEKNVQLVKDLLAQAGHLEFRILANEEDDAKAFEAAQKYLGEAGKDDSIKEALARLAMTGEAPPPPGDAAEFETAKGKFTYTWLELSRGERHTLGLDNAAEKDDARQANWLKAAEARKVGKPLVLESFGRCLLFSRACRNERLPKEEREQKKYDYFVLCRDPAKEGKSGKPRAVTGAYLVEVKAVVDQAKQLAVSLRFNKEGGERLFALTNANLPSGPEGNRLFRHLAIILDGQIMAAPRLNEAIRDQAQVSGNFTDKEVERLVDILRAGALPGPLKPLPVSETALEPK
jgi:SecD/SecF fusion protein